MVIKMWLVYLLFLLESAYADPYVVTAYYEVVGNSKQYVTIADSQTPSPLTVASSDADFMLTEVEIQVATGVGEPVQTTSPTGYSYFTVPITYSRCEDYFKGSSLAVPPITKSAYFLLPPPVAASVTPVTVYTTESTVYKLLVPSFTSTTTFPVVIINPTDVDPVDYAYESNKVQPGNCLTATPTAAIDYRNACKFGPSDRKTEGPPNGCGDLNPCCFDCHRYVSDCYLPPCPDEPRVDEDFWECADGTQYYSSGATAVDSRYTMEPPKETVGDWSDEQRGDNDKDAGSNDPTEYPTETAADGAHKFKAGIVYVLIALTTFLIIIEI